MNLFFEKLVLTVPFINIVIKSLKLYFFIFIIIILIKEVVKCCVLEKGLLMHKYPKQFLILSFLASTKSYAQNKV